MDRVHSHSRDVRCWWLSESYLFSSIGSLPRGPRKLVISFGTATLTHYGGVYLLHRFLSRIGFRDVVARQLRLVQRNNRYSVGETLLTLLYPMILGLERIESTQLLRQNGVFQYLTADAATNVFMRVAVADGAAQELAVRAKTHCPSLDHRNSGPVLAQLARCDVISLAVPPEVLTTITRLTPSLVADG